MSRRRDERSVNDAKSLKRNEFEEVNREVDTRSKGTAQAEGLWIFDNKVERASREKESGLAWLFSQGKVQHLRMIVRTDDTDLRRGSHSEQVSNESLILAQNQRWRRA